ncbi:hypothetical protein PAPYR_11810 [Paratrimastix pyriformis]|uniref:Uncharacterized protein n=1 Tax=Paratrimastix pyriformis TaxID=342808 RepID=A0ABQ8U314_9EUKA|nr:hypothetical protein PAPYR_11810 [Paratrimastix pyriformis]
MWQANLTEWYEEKPRWGQPQEGGKPRRRGQPQGASLGDRLGGDGHGGENPKGTTSRRRKPQGDNLKKEENPKGDNLKKEENPAEGDNLMREGAEENPDFGENLDGGMEDDAGDGNAAQAGDIGGILLWLRWLGLASFCLRALGTGRFGKETGSDIMVASDNVRLGDLEGLACQANWNFIVDRFKRWVGMKEVEKGWADIDLAEFLKNWLGG